MTGTGKPQSHGARDAALDSLAAFRLLSKNVLMAYTVDKNEVASVSAGCAVARLACIDAVNHANNDSMFSGGRPITARPLRITMGR